MTSFTMRAGLPGTPIWLPWFLVLLATFVGVTPCGITTHHTIGARAAAFFNGVSRDGVNYAELIRNHQDAFQASTSYPDAFYAGICSGGQYHDVAEDTHWTPFLEAAVKYIRATYPAPWTERAEKLVVFLLGIIQHQVSDVTWHNLAGIREGFLDVMGKTNFHGSFSAAHSHGDFGGDVINVVELNTDFIKMIGTWYIPVDDLLGIYRVLYNNDERITRDTIVNCNALMFLGRLGEKIGAINLVYPLYAMQSPFLLDRLQDYFLGGMDDMAAWTGHVWSHTADMLDQGTEVCELPTNPVYITCGQDSRTSPPVKRSVTPPGRHAQTGWHHPDTLAAMMGNLTIDDVVVEHVEGGVVMHATSQLQTLLSTTVDDAEAVVRHGPNGRTKRSVAGRTAFTNTTPTSLLAVSETDDDGGNSPEDIIEKITAILQKLVEINRNRKDGVMPTTPTGSLRTDDEYSRLGESLLSFDLNGDGYDDLVIGAPLYGQPGKPMAGRVYVIYGSAEDMMSANQTISEQADVIFGSESPNSRFGTALAAVDINADGYMDLAISAPMEGSQNLEYKGAVYVYYGRSDGTLSPQYGMKFTCTKYHCNMGWSLAGGDVNHDGVRDILIGCPFATTSGSQRGMVGAFYGKRAYIYVDTLSDQEFDWEWYGEQDWSWLGYSIAASADVVAIGAPQHRVCAETGCPFRQEDLQAAGQVYVFRTPLGRSSTAVVAGTQNFGQLGYRVALSQDGSTLAIGAPSEDQGGLVLGKFQEGRVYLYDTGSNFRRASATLKGEHILGRFGQSLLIRDVNGDDIGDVIVGAPLYNGNVWGEAQQGRVYVYHGKDPDAAVNGIRNAKASDADVTLTEGEGRSRFGNVMVAVGGSNKPMSLAVSSMHSNGASRLGGKVSLFDMQ